MDGMIIVLDAMARSVANTASAPDPGTYLA
jgi:hypothetical protein